MSSPRELWHPVLAATFGIRPWEMGDLTFDELNAMADYLKKQNG